MYVNPIKIDSSHVTNVCSNRAVFSEFPSVIGFALLRHTIGLKKSRHFVIQSEVKPDTLSRASRQLHVFTSSFDWFIELFLSFVIGQSDEFRFGFTHVKTALST